MYATIVPTKITSRHIYRAGKSPKLGKEGLLTEEKKIKPAWAEHTGLFQRCQ
jgi:hypothetical protein